MHILRPSSFTPGFLLNRKMYLCIVKDLYKISHSNIICNSLKLKTILKLHQQYTTWADTWIVVYSYNEILYINESEKTIAIHNDINESLKYNVKRRHKREMQSDLLKHDVCGPKNHIMQNHAINTIGPKEKNRGA